MYCCTGAATLNFYEQYAAAAYCPSNNDSPNTKVTCSSGNCPLVESDDTNTVSEFQNSLETDVTGFVALDTTRSLIVVSFRGSESLRNWLADVDFPLVATDLCADCSASAGFWNSWVEARDDVLAAIRTAKAANPTFQIVAVGHSLGGAIADFAAAELRKEGEDVALYTFGSPRIGTSTISDFITAQSPSNYRVTHLNDPVPRLPPMALGWRHVSPEYFISSANGVAVTENDVAEFVGDSETLGNAGQDSVDVNAHRWYFGNMTACYPHGDGIELRRGLVARF
ncbi:alpha/beta-hydrolase [Lepidopterella palustris CBS 459.81]|uniref:Alpha/beta-hydrolase n=1 Tax=Lepidopterella palustris CBS 459.81 TaxID=1314670 RepID=A0A8E2JGE4_9PEZI|nr:alpha/beta-hydrolase [Lepidopterella palustris CBS 459.81]